MNDVSKAAPNKNRGWVAGRVNFVIDALVLAGFVLLAATGWLMHFVLPPGSGRTTLWNMNRHAWGDVHFFLALVILGLLSLHLVLHWRWIVGTLRGRPEATPGARWRLGLAALALLALLAAAAAPFLASPASAPSAPGAGRGWRGGR